MTSVYMQGPVQFTPQVHTQVQLSVHDLTCWPVPLNVDHLLCLGGFQFLMLHLLKAIVRSLYISFRLNYATIAVPLKYVCKVSLVYGNTHSFMQREQE